MDVNANQNGQEEFNHSNDVITRPPPPMPNPNKNRPPGPPMNKPGIRNKKTPAIIVKFII